MPTVGRNNDEEDVDDDWFECGLRSSTALRPFEPPFK